MTTRERILRMALGQFGIQEISGKEDNPEVLKYFESVGLSSSRIKDETAWCSAFINWICWKLDLPMSGKLNARSWLKVGEATESPEPGDLVIFWRESPSSWKGHVGIFVRETKKWTYVLGGNQSNRVKISAYYKKRVLGYRKL